MKTIAYGFLLIYSIALPFFLFIPISNVYTYYNIPSALNMVIPNIENFFYLTTTHNNSLPSLHVATSILLVRSAYLTNNRRLLYFTTFCMFTIIFSVIYLAIHWITDIIFGGAIAIIAILLLKQKIKVD